MNYYEHHLGDYAQATAHLSMLEDAAYSRMLRWYYAEERPLPADERAICRIVRAASKPERDAVKAVLADFFELEDDGWHQRRCDAEIARFTEKRNKAASSANARWSNRRPQSERNANASTDAMRTHSERNANGMPHAGADARVPQTPNPNHQPSSKAAGSDSAASADPPTSPPAFDGKNAEILNGKAVVPLAASWELPEQWGLDAEALGFKPAEVLRESEKFRQYWTAGKGASTRRAVKSWRQTWSNWLEKAARDHR